MAPVTLTDVSAASTRSSLVPPSPSIIPLPLPKIWTPSVVAVMTADTSVCTMTLSSMEMDVPETVGPAASRWNVWPEPTIDTGPLAVRAPTSSALLPRGARSTTPLPRTASGE